MRTSWGSHQLEVERERLFDIIRELVKWENTNNEEVLARARAEIDFVVSELSAAVGVSIVNLSVLKNDRARAIRYSTLSAICRVLDCEVGELLVRAD